MDTSARAWAYEEFGTAELGDERRRARLLKLGASAVAQPAGTVTTVVREGADREGAFRFLENPKVEATAVASATHSASVRRCVGNEFVYVPIDGSSLNLTDKKGARAVGGVGSWKQNGRGLQVVTALAVSASGTPIGGCGQTWWARMSRAQRKQRDRFRTHANTEMGHSVELLRSTYALFQEQAPDVCPWFQFDRGFDAKGILKLAHEHQIRLPIRVHENRCVRDNTQQPRKYLHRCLDTAPERGRFFLPVPGRNGLPARTAHMRVRSRKVTIEIRDSKYRSTFVPMYVVSAREMRRKNKPLHWRLMTTYPVESFEDCLQVIHGYTARWRIEEFHRAWKRGVCNVEDTQLRGREAILKWATILAAVASRATRLTYLAREQPDLPASEEFSRWEIDATIALLRPKGLKLGAEPSLKQIVGWIAELGGCAGKYSGKPPGPTVIARGLHDIEVFARGLKHLREL